MFTLFYMYRSWKYNRGGMWPSVFAINVAFDIVFVGMVLFAVFVARHDPIRNCHVGLSNGHKTVICPEDL